MKYFNHCLKSGESYMTPDERKAMEERWLPPSIAKQSQDKNEQSKIELDEQEFNEYRRYFLLPRT